MESVIESNRLILRPWQMEDITAMQQGLNDYNVAKYLTVPFPYTTQHAKSYIEKHVNTPNTITNSSYAIVEKSSNKVIGGTSVEIDKDNVVHGGIWLNKNYHGKGYGTEVMRARAKYCFDVLKVDYLDNGFLEGNETSWHMQQKIGYVLTGEIVDNNCPARGGITKEIKTKLTRENFIE